MISLDKANSLKKDFEKESIEYWYIKALIVNNEEFNKLLAIKTRDETDKEIRILNFEIKVKNFLRREL